MNSFRFLERGIEAELDRQAGVVESGEEVAQETFHFDPRTGSLTPLRSKEYAHDYRYFPEPDLVPLAPTEEMLEAARSALPELPAHRRERYESELGLPEVTAQQLAFDAELGAYFERALDAARKSVASKAPRRTAPSRARSPTGSPASSWRGSGRPATGRPTRRDRRSRRRRSPRWPGWSSPSR